MGPRCEQGVAVATDIGTKKLLFKISKAYYEEGLTQEQIGLRLGLSRIKVSRLLSRARDEGIVHISVVAPQDTNVELERELESAYGLNEAIVVSPVIQEPSVLLRDVGQAAAACLLRCLENDSVLGMTWGTAILAVVDALTAERYSEVRVVQLLGGLGRPEAEVYGADLVRRAAASLGARPRILPAPGIVATKMVRDALLVDPQIADTLDLGAQAHLAVVGLGQLAAGSVVTQAGILTQSELDELAALGAVGDIGLRFFDADGNAIQHEINERIIGLDLAQIRAIPRVVGVAGGRDKDEVIRAALRGGLIDVLVTDDGTARRVLGGESSRGGRR